MTINDKISDEKLQYDVNREAVKISAFSSGITDIYLTYIYFSTSNIYIYIYIYIYILKVEKYCLLVKEK